MCRLPGCGGTNFLNGYCDPYHEDYICRTCYLLLSDTIGGGSGARRRGAARDIAYWL